MKKFYKILAIMAMPALLILYSYSSGSPGGKSGSPGDGGANCTQCHSGTPQNIGGWITTDIPAGGYTSGQSYTITATGTHNGVVKFGFELTAEDAFGNKFGTLSILEPARTKLTNANHAVTHTSGGNTPQGNTITWTMQWTAPTNGGSPVHFYAAFNAANGNGNTSGDVIYLSNLTVNQFIPPVPAITSVDPSHVQQGWMGSVAITGENTLWLQESPVVLFKFHNDHNIVLVPDSILIESDTFLQADFTIPQDAQIGNYDVYVGDLSLPNGFTVDIYDVISNNALQQAVNVYPVPAKNNLFVSAPVGGQIQLVDMRGKTWMSTIAHAEKTRLQIGDLPTGIYFVNIMSKGEHAVLKVLKK